MATVIDKLLVQIGLDSKGLTKGMDATLKQLKESEKATAKIAKNNRKNKKQVIEDSEESADALKEENKQYAILSRSLAGMAKGFVAVAASRKVLSEISDLSNVERVSKFLGMTSTQVGTLQKISENIGDSSQGALNSVADMYNAITGLELEGKNSELFKYFSRVGVSVTDQNGKLKDTRTLLTDIRKGLMGVQDERQRAYLARQMGLGEGLTYLFSKDDKEFNAALDTAEKQSQSVADASKKAQTATEEFNKAKNELKAGGMDILAGKGGEVLERTKEGAGSLYQKSKEKAGEAFDWAKEKIKGVSKRGDVSHAMNYLMEKGGLSREEAAAFVGSFVGESQLSTGAINPSSKATGIAQWLGARKKRFEQKYGYQLKDATLDEQLQYVVDELKTTEKGALKNIRGAMTGSTAEERIKQATEMIEKPIYGYERGDSTPALMARKKQAALDSFVNSLQQTNQYRQPIQTASTSPITINGDITVNTQATDAKGLVRDLSQQIGRKSALAEGGVH